MTARFFGKKLCLTVLLGGMAAAWSGGISAALTEECEASVSALRQCYLLPPDEWPAPSVDSRSFRELGVLPKVPDANESEQARRALGKRLFSEPLLSRSGQISCSSCHRQEQGFADGIRVPIGHDHERGPRNTPGLLNVGLMSHFFWDGRAASLEEQAAGSITNPVEMAATPEHVVSVLADHPEYSVQFQDIFGGDEIRFEHVTESIASWVKTLRSRKSPFDRFLEGQSEALSDASVRGLHLFRTKARCLNCHQGPLLSDGKYHNLGLTGYGGKREDLGRYLVTGNPDDVGRFKTPSLREISQTAPYFHWGTFPSLHHVLSTYNAGGYHFKRGDKYQDDPLFPSTSSLLRPLGLTDKELNDLESFLHSLSSSTRDGFSIEFLR
ncbi:cytochrome-c peroxidase [Marinobacter daepoensis]|uniref:Cytochrome-c peroxidase n=1 Tax=Marinobacter daepoensis TaxID=262077 RepID=A0ABS3BJL1_9GAMM|nr:cytochrome c peroxidase [Marinobacter daepoensis]MBN7771081.1 cytochrome-c peroxidase [Marinobacter daepoensis]MBY6078943.1 cytochrome-c peroxidase [Marinobacter daepoensis]